jgi:hypothetical protein
VRARATLTAAVALAVGALELSFILLLAFMLALSGVVALVVLVRVVEPRGLRALVARLAAGRRSRA